MKKSILFAILLGLLATALLATESLDEKMQRLTQENGKMYIKPFATAFGTNLNSGLYNTAKVLKPLRFGITFNTMMAFIPTSDQTFTATSPDDNYYTPASQQSATVFGDQGAIFEGPVEGSNLKLPNGADLKAIPLVIPQVQLGLPYGNELTLRGIPTFSINDYGDVSFFGIGLKHDIDRYIPLCPVSLAVQGVYQQMKAADVITVRDWAVNAEVSKTFLFLTVYGGLQYEGTNLKAEYTTDQINGSEGVIPPAKISFNLDGDNQFRGTAGIRLRTLIFNFNVDYSLAKYPALNLGLGMSL